MLWCNYVNYTFCSGAGWIHSVCLSSEWSWWIGFCVYCYIWSWLGQDHYHLTINSRQHSHL